MALRFNKTIVSILAIGIFSTLSGNALAIETDRMPALVNNVQAPVIHSEYTGKLLVSKDMDKNVKLEFRVSQGQSVELANLTAGLYSAILEQQDGSILFGELNVYEKAGQIQTALSLEKLDKKAKSGRSAFAVAEYECEPNDIFANANKIYGDQVLGTIGKKSDMDLFRITFQNEGDVALVLENIPKGQDYDLYVYNQNQKQIASSCSTSHKEIIKLSDVDPHQTYYVKVDSYGGGYDPKQYYNLNINQVKPVDDDYENDFNNAFEIVTDEWVKGRIDYNGDFDYFTFIAPKDGVYTISTTGMIDTYGSLFDGRRNLIAANDDGDDMNFKMEKELVEGQRYYVSVKHYSVGVGDYQLFIKAPSGGLGQNAGNSFDTATLLDLNESKEGWFENSQDARYFAFTPKGSGSYGFCTNGDAFDTYGTLYKADRSTIITENDNAGDGNHFLMANTLLAGETYYIKVSMARYDAAMNRFTVQAKQYAAPNDSEFPSQYHLLNTMYGMDANVLPARELAKGKGVLIAVADSGIDYNHADLQSNINLGLSYNFTHSEPNIFPQGETATSGSAATNGHGTHVAGIIGAVADNQTGITGIAPEATIVGYKVLGTRIPGNDKYTGSITSFVNAIKEAQSKGVRIMNCSFGGAGASALEQEAMQNAKDILFIVAAGNAGNNLELAPEYPACYYLDNSIVVAALDHNGFLAPYSNYGGPAMIAAPGTAVNSTLPFGQYGLKTGTSMATPIVTGVSGLVMGKNPALSNTEVKNIITAADNITPINALTGKVSTAGMVNAFKAVANDGREHMNRDIDIWQPSRDPFSKRDVKSVVTEIKNATNESEKTGNLIVKVQKDVDINQLMATVKQSNDIPFQIVSETAITGAFELKTNSVQEADLLVDVLNAHSEVVYAEPNYVRSER